MWFEIKSIIIITSDNRSRSSDIKRTKGGKTRTVDLHNQTRRLLYEYIYEGAGEKDAHDKDSIYVFASQRAAWLRRQDKPDNLSVRGINHLWKKIKDKAASQHYEIIADITFHDLCHDFAHRWVAGRFGQKHESSMAGKKRGLGF